MAEDNNNFFTSAFVSKDFVEGDKVDRAEVFVVIGRGKVETIITSGSGKSQQLVIDTGKMYKNQPLKSKAWAPTDSQVIKKAEEALEKDIPLDFRFETVRNKGVDRSIPIDVLKKGMENARENVIHSVAAVKLETEENWTNGIQRTNPKEDTKKTGRSALDLTDEELKSNNNKSNNNSSSFESSPWNTLNSDGSVNPGSVAVSVPLTIYNFIAEWNRTHDDVDLQDKQILKLTKIIMNIASKLQMEIYSEQGKDLDVPDYSLGSHTRARAIVFENIKNYYPITNDIIAKSENVAQWRDDLYVKSLKMYKWSINEIEKLVNL